ncbi:hypothetical protein HCZ30_16400 [Marivivens donghaensis]|uniref:Oligosaccharide repeat unit polymerase n=2 Tax=Marivivens donghaensis TaxID=1699413 RepID=A0ABX0W4Z3_9RHOB|nr:hypothetical protein [Marivivens donghaensis]
MLLFAFTPDGFSPALAFLSIVVTVEIIIRTARNPVSLHENISTQFHGEFLFYIFSYVILLYPYHLALFGAIDLSQQSKFRYSFPEMSNKAIIASTIFFVGFDIGTSSVFRARDMPRLGQFQPAPILSTMLLFLQVVSIIVFLGLGGDRWIFGSYSRLDQVSSATVNQFFFLATLLTMMAFASFIAGFKLRCNNSFSWVSAGVGAIWILAVFLIGDRNSLFLILISIITSLSLFYIRVRITSLAILATIAFTAYSGFEVARKSEDKSISGMISEIFDPNNQTSIADSSLANTTTSTRAAFYYVPDTIGYSYGQLTTNAILGIVPKLRSLVVKSNAGPTRSAEILTDAILGKNTSWGLGTSILADLYMDLGIFYVLFASYVLGCVWAWIRFRLASAPNDHDAIVLFVVATAFFAELARYGIAFVIRPIVWTYFILSLSRFISRFLHKV